MAYELKIEGWGLVKDCECARDLFLLRRQNFKITNIFWAVTSEFIDLLEKVNAPFRVRRSKETILRDVAQIYNSNLNKANFYCNE